MKIKTSLLITTSLVLLAVAGGTLVVLASFYLYLSPKLPPVESIRDIRLETPLRIYSADNKLIGEFGERRRYPVKYEDIPQDFINALIAAEDDDFYEHSGVSLKGLVRAVAHLIATGKKGSGGSTLTMQLTRHVFLSLRRTFSRKFNEILLALKIEEELSKEEILELYVNMMFLGKRAYGIQAAAEVYYGKNINELSLAQHAMLVGVFKGPTTQNPVANPSRAQKRRNYVLGRMLKLGYIEQKQFDEASAAPVTAKYHGSTLELHAPYVSEMARTQAIKKYGRDAYSSGYNIITTIDSKFQERANQAVIDGLLAYDQRHGYRGPNQKFDLQDAPEIASATSPPSLTPDAPGDVILADADSPPQNSEQEPPEDRPTYIERDYSTWLKHLKAIPTFGGLAPAVVTHIDIDYIEALHKNGEKIKLYWIDGVENIRPYLTENSLGPKPETPGSVVELGDLIRVVKDSEDQWRLTQIPEAQASLVSLSPENGAIRALVGGFDFYHSNFNRATQAQRQPGSNFKPFIYTAALDHGLTAATIMNDAPVVIADKQLESTWRPENSNKKFYGPTRLRKALYRSINLVSIRVLERVGVSNTINSLEKFGFDPKELPHDLSLALGTHAVTPLEVASGYAIFANGGYRISPYLIERIESFDRDVIYQALPATVCRECSHDSNEEGTEESTDEEITFEEAAPEEIIDTPRDQPNQSLAQTLEMADKTIDQNGEAETVSLANLPTKETGKQTIEDTTDSDYGFSGDAFEISFFTKQQLGIMQVEDYPRAPKVISDQVAFIIDSMLKDVVRRGTGYKAWKKFRRSDLGGKTGTTNGPVDAWFSGYHPTNVTSTWLGFDQNLKLGRREYGGSAALPIWMDFMETVLEDTPPHRREQPAGIISVRIDPETGMRARVSDPDAIFEIFRGENVPDFADSPEANPWDSEESISEELGF